MNLKKTYNQLMSIADDLHIKVVKGKGNFKGGACVYKKENIIVLNHNKPIEERLKNLIISLLEFDMSSVERDKHIQKLFEQYNT